MYTSTSYKEVNLEASKTFIFITSRLSDRLQISVALSGCDGEVVYGLYK